MTLYIGIDLSTNPANTGIAVLTDGVPNGVDVYRVQERFWCGTVPEWDQQFENQVNDNNEDDFPAKAARIVRIVNLIVQSIANDDEDEDVIVAIDVPFGWPKDFTTAIQHHKIGSQISVNDRNFSYRLTERIIKEFTGLRPLSGSTDKLGRTALLGCMILHHLSQNNDQRRFNIQLLAMNNENNNRKIIEVYPTATAYALARNINDFSLRSFYRNLQIALTDGEKLDRFDAVVAAFTGYLFQTNHRIFDWNVFGNSQEVQNLVNSYVASEGWIWAPCKREIDDTERKEYLHQLGEFLNQVPRREPHP